MKYPYLIISLIFALFLAGCVPAEDSIVLYPKGKNDFGIILNTERPYYTFNNVVIPLIKDERIYGQWYVGHPVISSIEINSNNTLTLSGSYSLKWLWAYPDILIIYDDRNGIVELLKFEVIDNFNIKFLMTNENYVFEFLGYKETF